MRFIAIDFETANEKRASACAIGLVEYIDGTATREASSLIRPHDSVGYFNPINVWVHGITADDVVSAPTWDELLPDIKDFVGDDVLVAHNMPFETGVLNKLAELYRHDPLENQRVCTLKMARTMLPDLPTRSLDAVYAHYFDGKEFNHHDALDDARACGDLFAHHVATLGWDDAVARGGSVRRVRRSRAGSSLGGGTGGHAYSSSEEELRALCTRRDDIEDKNVVFTGTLSRVKRADAQNLVEELGGICGKGVTKKTDYLVVGIPNPAAYGAGKSVSSKLEKATALREKGSNIMVISEDDFFEMLMPIDE